MYNYTSYSSSHESYFFPGKLIRSVFGGSLVGYPTRFFESGRGDEAALTDLLVLCCLLDFCLLLVRIVRRDRFPYHSGQFASSESRLFLHRMMVAPRSIGGGDNCGTGRSESTVWLSLARRPQRNEVRFGIVSPAAAETRVMDSRLDLAPDNWQCQSTLYGQRKPATQDNKRRVAN